MRSRFFKMLPLFTLFQIPACQALVNLQQWDLSACWGDGFDTCYELFFDNYELILGGQSAIEVIFRSF